MPPIIETERLILRLPEQSDLNAGWAEFHGDEEAMRFIGGPMPRSVAWRSLAMVAGSWSLLGFGQFSAIEKATGRWVGRVGPWRPEGWPAPEVGWLIRRSFWGQGYASEAGEASIKYVFTDLGWDRVTHMIHPGNLGSQAVARRVGSRFIADVTLPAPFDKSPTQMWGQTADEWLERQGRGRRSAP